MNRIFGILIAPCRPAVPASEADTQSEGRTAPPHSPLLGIFGAATLLIGILVLTGNMMLSPQQGEGLLQFLSGGPAAEAIRTSWVEHDLVHWAQAMLMLDSLWVLVYVPFLALLVSRLAREIRMDFAEKQRLRLLCWAYVLGLIAVLALGVADLVENWAAIGLLDEGSPGAALIPAWLMAPASAVKTWLLWASIALVATLFVTWYFDVLNLGVRSHLRTNARASQRVLLRLGVADIVWRSRYVMLMLLFFAAIVLGMDQARDVLVGMAQGIDDPKQWPRVAGGIVMSVVGVWVFAYACWLWCRVMARMLRPDDDVLLLSANIKAAQASAVDPANRPADGRDAFAKWWARLIGMTPFLMLAWVCGLASCDAVRAGIASTGVLLFWLGAGAVLLAASVLTARVYDKGRVLHSGPAAARRSGDKGQGRYYDVVGNDEAACELSGPRYCFPWSLPHAPLLLPILSLALFEVVRGLDLALDGRVPLAIAVIALALSLWTSVLGLIAQVALRQSVPWVLLLFLAIGVIGGLGWSDNHRVWTAASGAAGPGTLWLMWGFQFLLALIVSGALLWLYYRVAASMPEEGKECQYSYAWPRTWRGGPLALTSALVVSTALVLLGSDRLIFTAESQGAGQTSSNGAPLGRATLNDAIAGWIRGLKADWDQAGASGTQAAEVPVYFVSAEGGGIRSAYWTALVLDRLSTLDPSFPRRAFSISGVSGGSVGAAVWHGCKAARTAAGAPEPDPCVAGLGRGNLLTPLAAGWLFEDVLARVIPSSWCRLPGCGIMSRGNWFERSLELDVAELAQPMNGASDPGQRLPYLFLNSTWVENGERAIASRIEIDTANFPAAGDQLSEVGRDLLLSTAAHNSARFTYVNAIGSMTGKGHLADGGYFDNSGGHTTDDILRAFRSCLFDADDPCRMDGKDGSNTGLREWARAHLAPQAIQIRNGVGKPASGHAPESTAVCPIDFHTSTKDLSWYSDLLSPALAAFNAIGTGSNGRVSEANICKSVMAWRMLRGPDTAELPPLRRIDLTKGDVLYPLGWYLSPTACKGMEQAASEIQLPAAPSGAEPVTAPEPIRPSSQSL